MKKKKIFGVLLSCLACISMLSYSMLPVHAWNPENCEHPGYFSSIDPVPTGVYDYRSSGHYIEYGIANTCVKCRQAFFTDTYFRLDGYHEFPYEHDECIDGVHIYYCTTEGCHYFIQDLCDHKTCSNPE